MSYMGKSYIGTPTSRVDGRAKVTGAAKYAAEYKAPDLAYAAVVTSTIAKAASPISTPAMRSACRRPRRTHSRKPAAYGGQGSRLEGRCRAGQGTPLRPLHDDKILFSGQPVALVVAEEWEIARFAATLVHVDYEEDEPQTDLFAARDRAVVVDKPDKPRGERQKSLRRCGGAPRRRIFHPDRTPQPDGALRLDRGLGRRRQAHGLRQDPGRAERPALSVQRLRPEAGRPARRLAVVGGGFGSGLRPQYQAALAALAARALKRSVRLVLTRRQMYGLGYRPGDDRARRARRQVRRHARCRSSTRRPPSPRTYEDFSRNETAGRRCSTRARTPTMRTAWRGSISRRRATCARRARRRGVMRWNARWTNSPSR